jgi:ATP sulfurylase
MKTLTCDVCKHTIHEPTASRNYFHLAHRDLCEACKDSLELVLKPVVRAKQPFNYEWYNRLTQDSIEKAIIKGKF